MVSVFATGREARLSLMKVWEEPSSGRVRMPCMKPDTDKVLSGLVLIDSAGSLVFGVSRYERCLASLISDSFNFIFGYL